MINLEQGFNEVILTLHEKMTDINNNILIKIEKENDILIFTTGFTVVNERYDLLNINTNLEFGLYDYTISETSDTITDDMLTEEYFETLDIIEKGKLRVQGDYISRIKYSRDLNKKIYKR